MPTDMNEANNGAAKILHTRAAYFARIRIDPFLICKDLKKKFQNELPPKYDTFCVRYFLSCCRAYSVKKLWI